MFRVIGEAGRECSGLTRRSFVQAGLLGLGGIGLADLFRLRAGATADRGGRPPVDPPLDCAIAALVEDLIQRGLYERVLVVAMGEFGRTPRMNRDAGRDHWGNTFSVVFGGGGYRMGQVIGRSSPRGEFVVDRPVSPQDVAATVYHHLGIDGTEVSFPDSQGRELRLVENGQPIRELVG